MKIKTIYLCVGLVACSYQANAQLVVVGGAGTGSAIRTIASVAGEPLAGYVCATLNLTPEQMRDPALDVPILSEPSPASPRLGSAASIVFARSPAHVENGFAEVKFPNGKRGWIAAKMLKPVSFSCSPMQMADGRVRIGR